MIGLPYIILSISCFSIFLMLTKKPRYNFDYILSILILFIGFQHIFHVLANNNIQSSFLPLRSGAYPLTFGPFLYLYLIFISEKDIKFRPIYVLHFLPFLILFTGEAILGNPQKHPPYFYFSPEIYLPFILLSVLFYSVLMVYRLKNHRRNIENYFSNISFWKELSWINWMLGIYFLSNILIPLTHFFQKNNEPTIWSASILILFIFGISYFGIRQSIIFKYSSEQNLKTSEEKLEIEIEKYRNSYLKKEDVISIIEKIKTYMENQKPFLNPDFTIEIMSRDLKISKHKLSQSINEGMNSSFFALVNMYRVEEIKSEIRKNRNDKINFLNLAFTKGFNSKSTFNDSFKKLTGMTPSQYKNTLISQ